MMMVSHLLHPWANGVRALGAVPRCLADDLLVSATGLNHAARFGAAYAFTFSYLHALGAKAAPAKCYTFSTCTATRDELRCKHWVHANSTIQVCNSVRDLGGHLNFGIALCGSTFNARLRRAITMARALAFKPWGHTNKVSLIHMLILPLACYGSEAAAPADHMWAQLATAIAACIAPHNGHTSNSITFIVATKRCCEPGAYLL